MRLALLGDPVAHSLSPLIQNAAIKARGVRGSYEARKVDQEGVKAAFDDLRSGRLDGLNVTMPHKILAAALCDRCDPESTRAGSVNTVVREAGGIVGYSTDIAGIRNAWDGLASKGAVLILGAGGAAAAAVVALTPRPLYLAARRLGTGLELGQSTGVTVEEIKWGVGVVDSVVVNCTPLGMKGESLPDRVLDVASGLFDMTYRVSPTPAAERMRRRKLPVVEGLELLLAQAGLSFTIWTGLEAPLAEMRQAVENRSRP